MEGRARYFRKLVADYMASAARLTTTFPPNFVYCAQQMRSALLAVSVMAAASAVGSRCSGRTACG